MEKLIVLDYCTSTVHVHNIDRNEPVTEEYLESLGYSSGDCNWMAGDIEFTYHKGILK